MLTVKSLGEGGFRVTSDSSRESLLSRYGILKDTLRRSYCRDAAVTVNGGTVTLTGPSHEVSVTITEYASGFRLDIPLRPGERLFGLGDATRDAVMIRGLRVPVHVCNVSSYGPQPVVLSADGWAIVVNCTYSQSYDLGKTDPDLFTVYASGGTPDIFLFAAENLRDLLEAVTDITGKPVMLPAFGYGLTIVNNEQVDARALLENIRLCREREIPCDIMGLEPSWMGGYDFSINKRWDKNLFYLPHWLPANQSGNSTFFFPMRERGMQLSLWLCEEYDLFYEEERRVGEMIGMDKDPTIDEVFRQNAAFVDDRLTSKSRADNITKRDEAWFEHLKKFVDNGAVCFKLDGSRQVMEHPDRLWAEKYKDDEGHNVYPVILARQMQEGYRDHTDGRRAMFYSAGAFLGIQQYGATWAGDTGGGPRSLVSVLNYAMCGHTNTSCDLEINDLTAMHYAFLLTWTQHLCWANWHYPWYLKPETEENFRSYALLRSSLFPHLYAAAHEAAVTGMPVARPLPLVYPTDRFDGVKNAYMLGDSLFVGAFDMELDLPDGRWYDYFNDSRVYEGKCHYELTKGRGGALLAKAGSVVVTMAPQQYILEREHDYILRVYPGGDGEATLYEDDQHTYGYENGEFATTRITLRDRGAEGYTLTVGLREGSYPGRPDNGHDHKRNSIPRIDPMAPVRDMTVYLAGPVPASVTLRGEPVALTVTDGRATFTVPAALHESAELTYEINY